MPVSKMSKCIELSLVGITAHLWSLAMVARYWAFHCDCIPKTKEIATTHLLLSLLLQLDPNRYYKWLGWKGFVVLQKPGDTCPFAMEFIIFSFDKKVWLGRYADRPFARTLVPKTCTGKLLFLPLLLIQMVTFTNLHEYMIRNYNLLVTR